VTRKFARAALLLAPPLWLLVVFWPGLSCFFSDDDFAWLSLYQQVGSFSGLLNVLFAPAAQGTIRPWSERGFFLLFESLFGFDNLPMRVAVFVTMAACLVLLAWLVRRITGSAVAGAIAGIVWAGNASLTTVMTWSSAYNEALCPLFLLSALALFVRYAETGRRSFWWAQLAVFVLGFGALEINIVYPALAAAWVLFIAPPEKRRALLLNLIAPAGLSAAYYLLHRAIAPLPTSGLYAIHVDSRLFRTLALYCRWSVVPEIWLFVRRWNWVPKLVLGLAVTSLLILSINEIRQRRATALFFVAWFLVTIGPVSILPEHRSFYYLTIPSAAIGMLAAWGFHTAGRWRVFTLIPIAAYLAAGCADAHARAEVIQARTQGIRGLVLGALAAHERYPSKVILLDGVSRDLYYRSMGQGALADVGAGPVYLTPGSEPAVTDASDIIPAWKTVASPEATLHALKSDQAVVYFFAGDHLRNITEAYGRAAPNRFPDRLPDWADLGNPLNSWLLGPTWLSPDVPVRWMPAEASVRLRVPEGHGNKLLLEGNFTEEQLSASPRHLTVFADGAAVGNSTISLPETDFRRLFDVPDSFARRESVEFRLHVDPVTRIGGQEYGVLFGRIAVGALQP
jgi:hypothetical protein